MSEPSELGPPSPDAQRALAAFRRQGQLSPDAKDALRERIAGSIAARAGRAPGRRQRRQTESEQVDPLPSRAPIDIAGSAWRIGIALAAAAAVLMTLRLTAGTATRTPGQVGEQAPYGTQRGDATSRAVTPRTPATPRAPAAPPESSGPEPSAPNTPEAAALDVSPTPDAAPQTPTPPTRARHRSSTPSAPKSSPTVDDLAAELAMMRQARVALSRGAAQLALEILDEHARRFGSGQMLEDRQALRVQALCDAGQGDKARRAAQRFAREHPDSPHAGRIKKICRES